MQSLQQNGLPKKFGTGISGKAENLTSLYCEFGAIVTQKSLDRHFQIMQKTFISYLIIGIKLNCLTITQKICIVGLLF